MNSGHEKMVKRVLDLKPGDDGVAKSIPAHVQELMTDAESLMKAGFGHDNFVKDAIVAILALQSQVLRLLENAGVEYTPKSKDEKKPVEEKKLETAGKSSK